MRKGFLIVGAALLALAACKKAAPEAVGPDPAAASKAPSAASLTAAQAFELAFGKAPPAARTVTRPDAGAEETLTYQPAKLVPVGDQTALVSLATSSSDCHACSGALAVHYFKRGGDGWTLAGGWPEIVAGNGFGQPPSWRLRSDLGEGRSFIEAEAGWTGQGYTCTKIDLIELTPQGAVLRAENIPCTGTTREPPSPDRSQDGTLARGPDGKLRVTYTGQKPGAADYDLVGGQYVRVSGHDLFEEC